MVRLATAALVILVLVAGALVLRESDAPAPARARDGRVTIVMKDFRYVPQVIRARAGRLTIALRNEGRVGHGLRIRKGERFWVEQPTLLPGERAVVTRRFEPGRYKMFDALSNYEELGMYGTLIVR
jgi:plastocyanin